MDLKSCMSVIRLVERDIAQFYVKVCYCLQTGVELIGVGCDVMLAV